MNLYIFSFIGGGIGAWGIMKYGCQLGINDLPSHRSSHLKAVPKGGGIGILMVLVISSLILSIPMGFWIPAIIISIVSLWGGDKHLLSPKRRLFVHFACSFVFIFYAWDSREIDLVFVLLSLPLSVFIVGTSNFYNFMDGIDGLAGVTGVIGFSLLAFYSYSSGIDGAYGILCVSLVFSCIGFLCFNFPKAKVFLGDVGSVLLGFLFACLVIALSETVIHFLIMMGFIATFYFDELFTMIIRIRDREPLIEAHRNHIYQLLVNELSISHWKITLLYGAIQLVIGLTAIYVGGTKGIFSLLLLYLMYISLFVFISIKIHKKVVVK